MTNTYFWLSEDQFARLAPMLPTDTRGVPRVDDRRVISGIIHVLKSGCRWADAPEAYGPHKTLYNRFVRWRKAGGGVAETAPEPEIRTELAPPTPRATVSGQQAKPSGKSRLSPI